MFDQLPCVFDMLALCSGLCDAEAQREAVMQFRVRKIHLAALIDAIHDGLIDLIAAAMAEADEVEGGWCCQFKILVRANPCGKFLGELNMTPYMVL